MLRKGGTISAGSLAAMVENSWKRSQSHGIRASDRPDYTALNKSSLADAIAQNQTLADHARPVMETLYDQIVDTESMVILSDAAGTILHSLGDDDFLSRADKVALKTGVNWAEHTRGTNAIGTAIAEHAPTVIHGPEHFLNVNHFLTCSAAPITDPRGELMGVLDVTGDWRGYHPHTLALVRMSAQMIENQVFTKSFPDALIVHFHARPEFIGTLCEGIAAFRPDGKLIAANRSGLFQLNQEQAQLRERSFSQLFGLPMSTLIDHIRKPGISAPLQLSLYTGVRVWAIAQFGEQMARERQIIAQLQLSSLQETGAQESASMPARAANPDMLSKLTLDDLDTGDEQVSHAIGKVRRVLGRGISILIQGETGTGKEWMARAIHNAGPRAAGPFIAVNCASIPDGLIESELFGYEEGAFTGARRKGASGRILQANGGTLFLDEIGDMPLNLQARLLRVLQEKLVNPLGSVRALPVDVYIICATNRKLKELIATNRFREDLYFRLNGFTLQLPPLRERTDLATLIHRLRCLECGSGTQLEIDPEVIALFHRHAWPGNCRQLANVLRSAIAMCDGRTITVADLPDDFLEELSTHAPTSASLPPAVASLDALERQAIEQAISLHKGNMSAVARQLGISRNTLYRRLKQFSTNM